MKETQSKPDLSFEDKLRNTYPIQYFVTFGIITIGILFLGICVAYLFSQSNWQWENFKFPNALGCLFCILQIVGWFQLYDSGIYIAGKPDGSYLYLLTSLHAVHLFAGILILAVMFFNIKFKLNDQVAQLLHFSDNYQLIKLKQIAKYWHFVDVLWILLLLFFLFNHL